jgi:hypothetical protein
VLSASTALLVSSRITLNLSEDMTMNEPFESETNMARTNGQAMNGVPPSVAHEDDFDFDPERLASGTPAEPQEDLGPDPFDPETLRLHQDFATSLGVKTALVTVPVRKPSKEWFVRVHPDPTYRLQTICLELKEQGETYLVGPVLWPSLVGETTLQSRLILTAQNRQGDTFLWPLRLPAPEGRVDNWTKSALEASELAMRHWVRLQANLTLQAYTVHFSENLPDPTWPDIAFKELLRRAFKDAYIDSLDHVILRRLRGEI